MVSEVCNAFSRIWGSRASPGGQRPHEAGGGGRREHRLVVRLVQPGDQLRQHLVARDPGGGAEPGFGLRRGFRAQVFLLHVKLHSLLCLVQELGAKPYASAALTPVWIRTPPCDTKETFATTG